MPTPAVHDLDVVKKFVAAPGQTDFAMPCKLYAGYEAAWDVRVDALPQTFATVPGAHQFTCTASGLEGCVIRLGTPCGGGEAIVITRQLPIERVAEFIESGPVPMTSVNYDLNRIVSMVQDVAARFKRTLMAGLGDLVGTLPSATSRANKWLAFDADGQVVMRDEPAPALGSKGDPGGNVLSVGSFEQLGGLNIPLGTNRIQTSSYRTGGDDGQADYIADAAVDAAFVAAWPNAAKITANGRGFRLVASFGVLMSAMFGTIDGTNLKTTSEVVVDNIVQIRQALGYHSWLSNTRHVQVALSFADRRGLGVSDTVAIQGITNKSLWDTHKLMFRPGRFVNMTQDLSPVMTFKGKAIDVPLTEEWQVDGGTFGEVALGYSAIKAKTLVLFEDLGGSTIGSFRFWGARRYGIKASTAGGATPNNNIWTSIGNVTAIRCGNWGTSGVGKFNGTYTGTYLNTAGDSDSLAQRHRLVLTNTDIVDYNDLEVGDMLWMNATTTCCVMAKPAANTIDVFPWLPVETGGTYRSMHGGGFDCQGVNLTNLTFERLCLEVGGTAIRVSALYCPLVKDFLAEFCGTAVQLGMAGLESMEGLRFSRYHIENVINAVVDCAAASSGVHFGTPSNLEGTVRGKFDKCFRINPARWVAGAYAPPNRTTLYGVSFEMNGGILYAPNPISVEANLNGGTAAVVSNSPEYQMPDASADTFTFSLRGDMTQAECFRKTTCEGVVRGTGTNGAPTGAVYFQIDPGQAGAYNLEGAGAPLAVNVTRGALMWKAVLKLPPRGVGLPNWQIQVWEAGPAPPASGGGGGSSSTSGMQALPIDPNSLAPVTYAELGRSAIYQDVGTATPAVNTGDVVGRLSDLSGNFNHFTQGTLAKKPILRKLGPLTFIELDGANQWMKTGVYACAQPYTLIAAVLCDNGPAVVSSIFFGITAISALQAQVSNNWSMYANANLESAAGVRDKAVNVLVAVFDFAGTPKLYLNGGLIATGDATHPGNSNCNGLYLGVANSESSQFFKGLFWAGGQLGIALNASQVAGVTAWLTALTGK